jgi:hypothetical protein
MASPFVLPVDFDAAEESFVLPVGPIVAPEFASLAEERKYWLTMNWWYISALRSAVVGLERAHGVRGVLVDLESTSFHGDEKRELKLIPCSDNWDVRRLKESLVRNKYEFLREEYLWLYRLERLQLAQQDRVREKASVPVSALQSLQTVRKRYLEKSSSDTESVEVAVPESKRLKVSNLREKVEVPLNSSTVPLEEEDAEFAEWLRAVEGPRPTRK